jgi:hypothetical protein
MADEAFEQDHEPNALGGLYEGFESYRTPTKADYETLFSDGMIALDANVLLDLYLYHQKTRDDFIGVLDGLKECLWIPHQVMMEFWKNRDNKLRDPRESDAVSKKLDDDSSRITGYLRTWCNRVRLPKADKDRLADTLSDAFKAVVEDVKKLADDDGRQYVRDTNHDPLLQALEPILLGRVGSTFGKEQQAKALEEAARRNKDGIPPGYEDATKGGEASAGDFIVWEQILLESEKRKQDVLFITSDDKADWWRKDKDKKSLGPRPELANELRARSGRQLFMLPPDSLLYWARDAGGFEVSEESVEEVKEVSTYPNIQWADRALINRISMSLAGSEIGTRKIRDLVEFYTLLLRLTLKEQPKRRFVTQSQNDLSKERLKALLDTILKARQLRGEDVQSGNPTRAAVEVFNATVSIDNDEHVDSAAREEAWITAAARILTWNEMASAETAIGSEPNDEDHTESTD